MRTKSLVIVLEDDASMLGAVERILKLHGYEVEGYGSAKNFAANAKVSEARCLVLDIHLKDGSGLALYVDLLRSGLSPPVIFMTGRDNAAARKTALEAGCLAYLVKPFSSAELLSGIESIIPLA